MKILDTYIGIEPFTVPVDESLLLTELVSKARELRTIPFTEKLAAVKQLTLDSMVNAYEQMKVWKRKAEKLCEYPIIGENNHSESEEYKKAKEQQQKFTDIVFQEHPLSYALEQKAGCCRYQGALFFILGYEADLGDKHYIHAAPVSPTVNSVFNEIIQDGSSHKISIFAESLVDKSLDYSRTNPNVFNQAFERLEGYDFYSYHRTDSGLIIVANKDELLK